jgi:formamidopyrimidine-DNA glycosylase
MPELPEVETVARQLAPLIEGRTLRSVRILDDLLRNGRVPQVRGRRVEKVSRIGKQVALELSPRPGSNDPLWALVHLRMTGRLIHVQSRLATTTDVKEAPSPVTAEHRKRLRARFTFDRGELWFVDTRRFGTLRWARARADAEPAGVDPMSPAFTRDRLADLLGDSRAELKPWLLRQDRIVGLGNIYASEILHRARLSPFRHAGSLDAAETGRLHRSTRRILERAIENCGTTFSDFQDARGVEGSYQRFLKVYDREGQRCRRCRGEIHRVVQQQRSTFYCADCQR